MMTFLFRSGSDGLCVNQIRFLKFTEIKALNACYLVAGIESRSEGEQFLRHMPFNAFIYEETLRCCHGHASSEKVVGVFI
jgi:hypothetical protein